MQYVFFGLIGLVAGALAGLLLRGHYNVLVDIVIGVAGALLGGYLFLTYGGTFISGTGMTGGLIFAAIGAGVFLLGSRTLRSAD